MVAQPAWGHAAALTAPRAQLHQQHADVDKRQTAATTEPGAAVVTSCGHQDIRKLPAEPPSCVAGAAITRDGKHQKVGYGGAGGIAGGLHVIAGIKAMNAAAGQQFANGATCTSYIGEK
eukprot:gene16235-19268_t